MIAKSGIAKKFAGKAMANAVGKGGFNVTDIVKKIGEANAGGGQQQAGGGGPLSNALSDSSGQASATPQDTHKNISGGSDNVIANIAKRRTQTDPLALALKKDKK